MDGYYIPTPCWMASRLNRLLVLTFPNRSAKVLVSHSQLRKWGQRSSVTVPMDVSARKWSTGELNNRSCLRIKSGPFPLHSANSQNNREFWEENQDHLASIPSSQNDPAIYMLSLCRMSQVPYPPEYYVPWSREWRTLCSFPLSTTGSVSPFRTTQWQKFKRF